MNTVPNIKKFLLSSGDLGTLFTCAWPPVLILCVSNYVTQAILSTINLLALVPVSLSFPPIERLPGSQNQSLYHGPECRPPLTHWPFTLPLWLEAVPAPIRNKPQKKALSAWLFHLLFATSLLLLWQNSLQELTALSIGPGQGFIHAMLLK